MWWDPNAGLKPRTFSDADKAQELKDFLDSNGNSYKLVAKAKAKAKAKVRKDSTAPTVYEVIVRHIDLLRKPHARRTHRPTLFAVHPVPVRHGPPVLGSNGAPPRDIQLRDGRAAVVVSRAWKGSLRARTKSSGP